ncbi:MAG: ABC transporter ATP-binding protein [Treponema sp.]|jgi:oligopeptide/dipeptide ABC transporter ATP-binding protein|nr:ABC transporter ATP-binding protein [Treponema sp.]
MAETILQVEDLEIEFTVSKHRSVSVVQGLSFIMEKGSTLAVVGESGCGKSITAKAILQLLPAGISRFAKGRILLDGLDLTGLSAREMRGIRGRRISMIFQEPMTSLNPVQRIGRQMIEALLAHRKISGSRAKEIAIDMLKKTGLPDPENRIREYPHELSGGMRQRVMIAMALLASPELLIADEPTTALDVTIQAQILKLLGDIKQSMNTSIMLITHDMGVVAEMADSVMVMYAGKIVEHAPVKELFHGPLHPYTEGLLKSTPRLDTEELHAIEGTVPSPSNMPKGCHFSTRCNRCMERCRKEEPPLYTNNGHRVSCWLYV